MVSDISIVIPAYNEERTIADCLSALVRQTTKEPFEVIVVDNDSKDRTAAIADTFRSHLSLSVVSQKNNGRGEARYTGFSKASGRYILSTDADAIVPDDWVEKIMATFSAHPSAIAVTGPCRITDTSPATNTALNFLQPLTMRMYRVLFGHYWLSGFNFAIKKIAYVQSGGFDPELQALEDIDLSFKVSRIGPIVYMPRVPVIESGRRFRDGIISGSLPYFRTFIAYHWMKRKDIIIEKVD